MRRANLVDAGIGFLEERTMIPAVLNLLTGYWMQLSGIQAKRILARSRLGHQFDGPVMQI